MSCEPLDLLRHRGGRSAQVVWSTSLSHPRREGRRAEQRVGLGRLCPGLARTVKRSCHAGQACTCERDASRSFRGCRHGCGGQRDRKMTSTLPEVLPFRLRRRESRMPSVGGGKGYLALKGWRGIYSYCCSATLSGRESWIDQQQSCTVFARRG